MGESPPQKIEFAKIRKAPSACLGYFKIKTTERYLHVKKDALISIASPLDDLWKKGDI
jgi:hypothetical protein